MSAYLNSGLATNLGRSTGRGNLMRPPNPGPAPIIDNPTGFGIGGAVGIGRDSDAAFGHVHCRIGLAPAAAGTITLIWPQEPPAASAGVWLAADWATFTQAGNASLDLGLMGPTLDPRVTLTRGSVATYFDQNGVMQTVSGNAPRFDYDPNTHTPLGLLIEEARTNLLLNSATLGTQSVTTTATATTLSFYGTGTVTMSGTFAGSLVGTGPFPARVSQTFTPTAGTLTLTVTGSVLNAQLEAGAFATSYIPTTGASVTRNGEFYDITPLGTWYAAGNGTMATDWMSNNYATAGGGTFRLDDGTANNSHQMQLSASSPYQAQAASTVAAAGAYSGNLQTIGFGAVNRAAMAWQPPGGVAGTVAAVNGAIVAGAGGTGPLPSGLTRLRIGCNGTGVARVINGWMRRVRYWNRVLDNPELQAATSGGSSVQVSWNATRPLVQGETVRIAYQWNVTP